MVFAWGGRYVHGEVGGVSAVVAVVFGICGVVSFVAWCGVRC